MEAPVPASALIHSATLVSAGVFLIIKFYPIIEITHTQNYILIIGSITAAIGGVTAAAQTDIKKLLAYSTISHCGFLFICCSFGDVLTILVYLYLHGLFKASTFFCAGAIIKNQNTQDMRMMGLSFKKTPVDVLILIICSLNLGGLPFTVGYLYKNLFLQLIIDNQSYSIILGLQILALLSSVVYTFKIIFYSSFDYNKNLNNNNIILNLQFNQKKKNFLNYTNYSLYISSFVILLFSLIFYKFFYYVVLKNNIIIDFNFDIFLNKVNEEFYLDKLYKNYFNLYHNLYFLTFILLLFLK